MKNVRRKLLDALMTLSIACLSKEGGDCVFVLGQCVKCYRAEPKEQ
jgi:hypothetical protein